MDLIDFHAHFFSRTFFETLAAQSPNPKQLENVVAAAGVELPDPDPRIHARRWLAEMDRHRISRMALFASLPSELEDVAAACQLAPDRLTGFQMVPGTDPQAIALTQRAAAAGFRGILLFPVMQGFGIADDCLAPLLAAAAKLNLIVIVHFGLLEVKLRDLLKLPRPFDLRHGNPSDLVVVANRHPATTFVIPHFGCGFFREVLMAGKMCPNVYLDTSSSNAWLTTQIPSLTLAEVFTAALNVFGPNRLLFGTDSSIFPRGWRADLRDSQREALDSIGMGPATQQLIFHDNAQRLMGAP